MIYTATAEGPPLAPSARGSVTTSCLAPLAKVDERCESTDSQRNPARCVVRQAPWKTFPSWTNTVNWEALNGKRFVAAHPWDASKLTQRVSDRKRFVASASVEAHKVGFDPTTRVGQKTFCGRISSTRPRADAGFVATPLLAFGRETSCGWCLRWASGCETSRGAGDESAQVYTGCETSCGGPRACGLVPCAT